ncbi:MAG: dipeptidase PepV [Chthonomonadales bacterium]
MSDEIALFHNWIDAHKDEFISGLQGCLRIPSKKEDASGPKAPYGQPIREALTYTLDLCEFLGFRVKDVDGHAGHAEFGDGVEMVAALGHLDVVPEGDRWVHDPYGAEIDNGYIFARGASDDKGPTYAALFGAKAVMESGLPLKRRIRVIFGCDEESGFGCVHHYWDVAKEERPVLAFTPDASFPLVYAEKGIANLILETKRKPGSGGLKLVSADGGRRPNMVPDRAVAKLNGDSASLISAARTLADFWDKNVSFEAGESQIIVTAIGKSAHGATPQVGDNAVARLCRALADLDLPEDKSWLQFVAASEDPTGASLGYSGRDDVAGSLTSNLGVFLATEDVVQITMNVRYCVTWTIDNLLAKLNTVLSGTEWYLAEHSDSIPLHVPLDKEPVTTLLRVYREETQDYESQPYTIGGGTYARATPNAVCFGASFPEGDDGPAHEPEEKISIEDIIRSAKIYAHALYELAK